jgi:hypothetical protein
MFGFLFCVRDSSGYPIPTELWGWSKSGKPDPWGTPLKKERQGKKRQESSKTVKFKEVCQFQ